MNKALIFALILISLFQLFSQKITGVYYKYDDNIDIYQPVYTAKSNSGTSKKSSKKK